MAVNALPAAGSVHQETRVTTFNGFAWLAAGLALVAWALYVIGSGVVAAFGRGAPGAWPFVEGAVIFVVAALVLGGLYTLQPNEAAILQLFGAYKGTTRVPGLRGTNPFYTRRKISLRARNLNGERLKVNDKRGNPIEIAAVLVWRVDDTAKAYFDVDDYENYVKLQAEAAVRHLASSFAYDEDHSSRRRPVSRRCSQAPTSSCARSCANCRRASTRRASWSRRHGSRTWLMRRRSRR
jgi:SPFH domain / Band 7 family